MQMTDEKAGRYKLKAHCFTCSGRVRSVLMKESDESVKSWFKNLRKDDPEEYRKIVLDADSKKSPASNYLPANKFNLASYKETYEQRKGRKLKAGHSLLTWPWYKARWLAVRWFY